MGVASANKAAPSEHGPLDSSSAQNYLLQESERNLNYSVVHGGLPRVLNSDAYKEMFAVICLLTHFTNRIPVLEQRQFLRQQYCVRMCLRVLRIKDNSQ